MLFKLKSDTLGAVSGSLCLIHCLATPLLFAFKICTVCREYTTSDLWEKLDFVFLLVSFIAIFYSAQQTSKLWMKISFWVSWALLSLCLLNEKMEWFFVSEFLNYIPAIALIFLHLYNRRYCSCKTDAC